MLNDGTFGAIRAMFNKRSTACVSDILEMSNAISGEGHSGRERGDVSLLLQPHAMVKLSQWLEAQYVTSGTFSRRHNPHIVHQCSGPLTAIADVALTVDTEAGPESTTVRREVARWAHSKACEPSTVFRENNVQHMAVLRSLPNARRVWVVYVPRADAKQVQLEPALPWNRSGVPLGVGASTAPLEMREPLEAQDISPGFPATTSHAGGAPISGTDYSACAETCGYNVQTAEIQGYRMSKKVSALDSVFDFARKRADAGDLLPPHFTQHRRLCDRVNKLVCGPDGTGTGEDGPPYPHFAQLAACHNVNQQDIGYGTPVSVSSGGPWAVPPLPHPHAFGAAFDAVASLCPRANMMADVAQLIRACAEITGEDIDECVVGDAGAVKQSVLRVKNAQYLPATKLARHAFGEAVQGEAEQEAQARNDRGETQLGGRQAGKPWTRAAVTKQWRSQALVGLGSHVAQHEAAVRAAAESKSDFIAKRDSLALPVGAGGGGSGSGYSSESGGSSTGGGGGGAAGAGDEHAGGSGRDGDGGEDEDDDEDADLCIKVVQEVGAGGSAQTRASVEVGVALRLGVSELGEAQRRRVGVVLGILCDKRVKL